MAYNRDFNIRRLKLGSYHVKLKYVVTPRLKQFTPNLDLSGVVRVFEVMFLEKNKKLRKP